MSEQKYDFQIDLSNRNVSHTLMIELIGANRRVLEVGCATGYMSRVLSDRGCHVIGLELDPAAADKAREYCAEVIVADIETYDLGESIDKESLDVVVFGDVLEHLRDPLSVLRSVRPLLRPDGYIVASIPNIAHGAVRLSLLKGRFDYRSLGLLDDTHLRFFTRAGIEHLFREAGFALLRTERTTAGIFDTEIPVSREEFEPGLVEELESDPEAQTYQFVVQAMLDNSQQSVRELHDRTEAQREEILQLVQDRDRWREKAERTETLAEERAKELEAARAEFERVSESLVGAQAANSELEASLGDQLARWERIEARRSVRLYRALKRGLGKGS